MTHLRTPFLLQKKGDFNPDPISRMDENHRAQNIKKYIIKEVVLLKCKNKKLVIAITNI